MPDAYEKLLEHLRDIGRLRTIEELLGWDQETQMPKNGVRARSEQSALIAGIAHERLVSDELRHMLESATAPPDDFVASTNIREARRAVRRAANVPTQLVKDIARTSSLAKQAWTQSREESNFSHFEPLLGKLIDLKKQVAEAIGYEGEPYDALMDEFEPGATAAEIEKLFGGLRDRTVALLARIKSASTGPDSTILTRTYPKATQETLSRRMAEALHYDFDAGRCDVSVHPFCCTVGGPGDVRITTRYNERFITPSLFGTLHEVGHALYEQGLPPEHLFTPYGDAVSLGIHESQSRLWENFVGRSREFWTCHWDEVRAMFPEALGDVTLDQFYGAVNTVAPSLIRVEADELTYNLHIILRFEIERGLFNGTLQPRDVPAAWNEKMKDTLGIRPDNDKEGCLQDIHWSLGAFGYFPTYALGNLYAAQFCEQAQKDIPDLFQRIAAKDNRPLLDWLRANIHAHGRRYRAGELVERVTGRPLSIDPLMSYLDEKLTPIYGL